MLRPVRIPPLQQLVRLGQISQSVAGVVRDGLGILVQLEHGVDITWPGPAKTQPGRLDGVRWLRRLGHAARFAAGPAPLPQAAGLRQPPGRGSRLGQREQESRRGDGVSPPVGQPRPVRLKR